MPPAQQLALEIFKASLPLIGALIGASAALLAGVLSDRRKVRHERLIAEERERALLTAMYAVRNHIAQRLGEYEKSGRMSALEPLRSAHRYVDKIIDKAPPHGEALIMAIIEIGLKLDAVLATIDRRQTDPALQDQLSFASIVTKEINELLGCLEQFDLVALGSLHFLTEEDLAYIVGKAEEGAPPMA